MKLIVIAVSICCAVAVFSVGWIHEFWVYNFVGFWIWCLLIV